MDGKSGCKGLLGVPLSLLPGLLEPVERKIVTDAMTLDGGGAAMLGRMPSASANGTGSDGIFSRLEMVMGTQGLARLSASKVVVLGLGGVGSNCVEALVRGGVGNLVLVDCDVVAESNINRQAIAFFSTVGRRKTDVMSSMAADINPNAQVTVVDRFLLAEDVPAFMDEYAKDADYVIDAIDTVSSKLAVALWAESAGVRLISSMGAANKLRPECLRVADLYETTNCPLCRVMRKEGRKRGIHALRVLYSCEQPVEASVREEGSGGMGAGGKEADRRAAGCEGSGRQDAARCGRSGLGTASYMPPIMGQMIAGVVLRDLAGLESGKTW